MTRRRTFFTAVAVLCAVAQLGLGASAALGLVLCVGIDHAAIELPSDDCCESHGGTARRDGTVLAASCCSDVPLVSTTRSLSDVRRLTPLEAPAAVATVASIPGLSALGDPFSVAISWSPPPPRTLRPVILRV